MRIPLSWLKEYIPLHQTPEEIAKILTSLGIEVENIETPKFNFEGIIVGKVVEAEKHPNADKLSVARVTDGKETYQVVCAAPNCRAGIKTAFAPIGASITEEDGSRFEIKKAKLRGVESFGMLCSGKELQVSEDADGILELPESFQEGTPLETVYGDIIFEVALTPNLTYASSLIGIARELSAATGIPYRYPTIKIVESPTPVGQVAQVKIEDFEGCPRYTSRVIKNIKLGPSPSWLQRRLEQCGLRSVNNVVDITNYVLLEMGHPLHAFDYERLQGHQVVIKRANEGDIFTTLDGKERQLDSNDLMICDANQSVAIAGVMGGSNSEVQDKTRHVLLESAYFDPISIRKTSKRLGLQTDASKRFERGTDPNQLTMALDRASMLIQEIAGGEICQGVIDVKKQMFPPKTIQCRINRVNQVLGTVLSQGEVETIFTRLGFPYKGLDQGVLEVQVPTYRVDIQGEIDLVEEVARFYGYDNIPKQSERYHSSALGHTPMYLFEREVTARLIGEGLQQFLTCDLIGPTLINMVQSPLMPPEAYIKVLNPTSIEQSVLRTSLLPGLLQVVKFNIDHHNPHIAGFEVGRVHFKEGDQYKEPSVAAIILSGTARPYYWDDKPRDYDFFDLKGIVENLLKEFRIDNVIFKNLNIPIFHSGRQASVFVGEIEIGSIGEIHPAIIRRLDVTQRILFGEFNLEDLLQVAKPQKKVKEPARYPGSERDWTLTIKEEIPFVNLLQAVKEQASPLLEDVSLLDIYRHERLGPGFQNITLHFVYRDLSKTVEQETVDAEHQRLTAEVVKKMGNAVKV